MYHIKNDQRAIRSAEAIYEALIFLISTGKFETITVSELVEQAQIGRATFYRNFDTIEDVLRWQCDQTLDKLIPYLTDYQKSQKVTDPIPLLKPMLRFFYLHSSIIELLIKAKRTAILQMAFQNRLAQLKPKMVASLDVSEEYVDYILVVQSGTAVNILVHWVENGKRHAPDDLADTLNEIMQQKMSGENLLL